MRGKEIYIDLDMAAGEEIEVTAWGCDLSYDYVRINAGK
jgi:N-acetylglutamate synthase/N-acetylornithine aminotransferase